MKTNKDNTYPTVHFLRCLLLEFSNEQRTSRPAELIAASAPHYWSLREERPRQIQLQLPLIFQGRSKRLDHLARRCPR